MKPKAAGLALSSISDSHGPNDVPCTTPSGATSNVAYLWTFASTHVATKYPRGSSVAGNSGGVGTVRDEPIGVALASDVIDCAGADCVVELGDAAGGTTGSMVFEPHAPRTRLK